MRLTLLALMMIVSLSLAVAPGLAADPQEAKPNVEKLMNPAQLNETAPDKFQAIFDTSKGEFIVDVTRAWSPNGADRFYNLVKNGYYNNCRFFRVVKNFMVQFGISGDPKLNAAWNTATIRDDHSAKQSNARGYITYAKTGAPNSRTTQVFINFADNSFLDSQGFTPFGKISKGMDIVDAINAQYGESPNQTLIQSQGNAYLEKSFPKLDYVKTATIVPAK
jgi:peptidyl-prolyl cis-trans isomerase A (cyclophilin A)